MQVNGGGDVLFNDMPTAEGIRAIAAAHRKFGTTALLPTLISDTPDKMANRTCGRRGARRNRARHSRHPSRGAVSLAGTDQACTIVRHIRQPTER